MYADIRLTAPIPLYGPPGIAERLAGFLTNSSMRSPIESAFAVTELAAGCDVLLCEADSAQVLDKREQVHHTPEDAGDTATAAGAGRLIITHVGRALTPQAAVERAATRFDGHCAHAEPGVTFTIGEAPTPTDAHVDSPTALVGRAGLEPATQGL